MNATPERRPWLPRLLAGASWLALVLGIVTALGDRAALWAIHATGLGATNMGLALFLSFAGAYLLIAAMFATPLCVLLATIAFAANKKAAWRFLAAAAAFAVPLAIHVLS